MVKELVAEISTAKNRFNFIIEYLKTKNIEFSIQKYKYGKNIEIKKEVINKNEKEIILMAHYDVLNKNYENANDNTSSIAVLLVFAEYIKKIEVPFNLKIVFNDNEELLGALHSNKTISFLEKIIEKSGSYFYLKKYASKKSKVIILELTGIGDCLYFATSSGGISCNKEINEKLIEIAKKNNFKYSLVPIPQTDYISIHILKLSGTVLGSLPYFEYLNYKKSLNKTFYPDIWKRNHTSLDKVEALNEKSLQMVYSFLIKLIEEF